MEGPDAAYSAINLGANAGGKLYFNLPTGRGPWDLTAAVLYVLSSLLRRQAKKGFAVSHSITCWIKGSYLQTYPKVD